MSNETNRVVDSKSGETYVQREGTMRIYLAEFGGQYKGLRYNVPQFVANVADDVSPDTEDGKKLIEEKNMKAVADMANKYGWEKVCYLANTALGQNTRNKVTSTRIPHFEDKAAESAKLQELIANNPEIFTVEEAEAFIPGVREITSNGFIALAKEAKKNGNMELFKTYMAKAMDAAEREALLQG